MKLVVKLTLLSFMAESLLLYSTIGFERFKPRFLDVVTALLLVFVEFLVQAFEFLAHF